jgi:hypothetical protein
VTDNVPAAGIELLQTGVELACVSAHAASLSRFVVLGREFGLTLHGCLLVSPHLLLLHLAVVEATGPVDTQRRSGAWIRIRI